MRKPVFQAIPYHRDYLASPDGRIKRKTNAVTIHQRGDGTKYVRVNVGDGKRDDRPVAYLVALTFVGIPTGWHNTLVHLNGDHSDCSAANLAWVPNPYRDEVEYRWLMRDDIHPHRVIADRSHPHGRLKVASTCRYGHPLSRDGKDDENTLIWGFGNRICRICQGRP